MVSADTNIAIYSRSDGEKGALARAVLASCDFLSVQVLNEFAAASRRKLRKSWREIGDGLADLRDVVPDIRTVGDDDNQRAASIAERYQIQFYDALMIAVALANDATTLFSEDMQHGLVIDETLRIENPFA